jgi:hypothetical protein
MEDKVKFVGIIHVRNLWYEDHSRGFQRYLPVLRRQTHCCLWYGVKHTATPHKSSSAINFHKVERSKLI